MIIENSAAVC